jgi:hypothetical protein
VGAYAFSRRACDLTRLPTPIAVELKVIAVVGKG